MRCKDSSGFPQSNAKQKACHAQTGEQESFAKTHESRDKNRK
jgi:hypothetical protein